ncbi:hypothetical protein [Mycobacterium sp. 4858]|uniref:hypothetical protein n=1 Tax=Mycobacterium sp. 4858 TaxID=2057185 RepID=UPI0018EE08B8|nr:hypothetical protein [Mycobacterium sp. 4858]
MPENARGATGDLTDLAAVEQLAADIGDIDHLVYTAGDSVTLAPVADLTLEMITGFFGSGHRLLRR